MKMTLNGQDIEFGTDQNESFGIVTKVAQINEEMSLRFNYNVYYEIGGRIDLLTLENGISYFAGIHLLKKTFSRIR